MKKYRDPIEHGSSEKLNIDKGILEELIETTVPMVVSLVPDVAGDLDEIDNTTCNSDINQERLKATIALEKSLGTAFVSEMSSDINEQLIRSEMILAKYTDDKTIEIIKCYSSVIQHALFEAVKNRKTGNIDDDTRESAVEKIVQANFFSQADQVPQEITTVAPHNFRRAVQGSSTTLGAHLLAAFLLGSESELIQLQKSDPTFVDFVAKLILLRGHGNEKRSEISRDDIEFLKNNVFKAIKILTEVF
ncbi:MAG: hypothetical protein WCJ95_22105 [Mariniphaga sp.]